MIRPPATRSPLIAQQGLVPAVAFPEHRGHLAREDRHHHDLVVAQQRHESAVLLQIQQLVQDATTIRPAIDVIAQQHQRIGAGRSQRFDQRGKCLRTAVNVTNGNCAIQWISYGLVHGRVVGDPQMFDGGGENLQADAS